MRASFLPPIIDVESVLGHACSVLSDSKSNAIIGPQEGFSLLDLTPRTVV